MARVSRHSGRAATDSRTQPTVFMVARIACGTTVSGSFPHRHVTQSAAYSRSNQTSGQVDHTIAFKDRVDFGKVRLPDIPSQGADIILYLGRFATANQGCADHRMRERPAQRKLRQAFVITGGQTLQLFHRLNVVGKVVRAETWSGTD